jgi:hypothetical protein
VPGSAFGPQRGHEGGGEGAPGKKISGGAHLIGACQGAVGRRDAVAVDVCGAGTVVANDGALALHHGEGESEVRWVEIDGETARSVAH